MITILQYKIPVLLLGILGITISSAKCQDLLPGRMVKCPALSNTVLYPKHHHKSNKNKIKSAQFNVSYQGFSPQAQEAFQKAVDIWATELVSTVPIEVIAVMTDTLGAEFLGLGGPTFSIINFEDAPYKDVFYPLALANAISRRDLQPDKADIIAVFNKQFRNWYFGVDGNPAAGQIDFVTLVLHELAHGLGFVGSAYLNGDQAGIGDHKGRPLIYDLFINDANSSKLTDFPNPSIQLKQALESNALFFSGDQAIQANQGISPKIYAPSPFDPASSYSHWDNTVFVDGDLDALMGPAIRTGESFDGIGEVTLGLMQDLGWSINPGGTVIIDNFTAKRSHMNHVILEWGTVSEIDNVGFEIQRAFPGEDFVSLGFIPGNPEAKEPQFYQFGDDFQLKEASYRLKYILEDQTLRFSPLKNVTSQTLEDRNLFIAPNPATQQSSWGFNLGQNSNPDEIVSVELFNTQGQAFIQIETTLSQAQQILASKWKLWLPGLYILKVRTEDGAFSARFIKLN